MMVKQGRFVEYSVFGKETSVDWTIISDAKGTAVLAVVMHYLKELCIYIFLIRAHHSWRPFEPFVLPKGYLLAR